MAPTNGAITQVWELGSTPKLIFATQPAFNGGTFALSPAGTRLLVSDIGQANAFDVNGGKPLSPLGHTSQFSHAFFRDESVAVWVLSAPKQQKQKVYVYDVVKGKDAGTFDIPDARFATAFPAKNRSEFWFFWSTGRFEVECYDVMNGKLSRVIKPELETPEQRIDSGFYRPSVDPDGSAFAASVMREKDKVYHGATGKGVVLPHDVYAQENGLVPGGTLCLCRARFNRRNGGTLDDDELILLDWKSGRALAVLGGFSPVPETNRLLRSNDPRVGVSADGKTAVLVSSGGEVLVFDLSGRK